LSIDKYKRVNYLKYEDNILKERREGIIMPGCGCGTKKK
jgi:hypothetical protein